MKINYHGKKFRGVVNTPNGQVSGDTIFHYRQDGQLLTATYAGGQILQGYMLGKVLDDDSLEFVYHHLDAEGNIKSGQCKSVPEILEDGRIRLHETWEWTFGGSGSGKSIVEEID